MSELEPCPFCKGKASTSREYISVDGKTVHEEFYVVHWCGLFPTRLVTRRFATEEEAIAAWNDRPTLGSEQPPVDRLIRCLENDYGITASWDGLRKVWLTERATLGSGTCEYVIEDNMNETEGMGDVWFRCTNCDTTYDYYADDWLMKQNYCPHCGFKIWKTVGA